MKNIFGIVGWSGSGKTHLICRIIKYFDKKKLISAQLNILITILKLTKREKIVTNILNQGQKKW